MMFPNNASTHAESGTFMTLTIRLLATINALVLCAAGAFAGEVAPSMRTHTLAVGDKKLAYLSTGVGPAVVIVHGVGGHKEDWEGVATALAKTHRVYALDMLGFGGSSKNGDDLSMPVQADAIEALLDHHHIRHADLVGNSVGGCLDRCGGLQGDVRGATPGEF
jgi:hypothetical protein